MIPRLSFAHLPTPVESAPRLAGALGLSCLLIKRDDQTGLAFGGNKTRKLEFLLAEAREQGCRTLITAGAVQSNHCRQTAAAAAKFGFDCILVIAGEKPALPTANVWLDELLGAQIVWVATREEREKCLQETFDTARKKGRKPSLIPYGGSNPIGALAYAYAMEELLAQGFHPDWIVFASSSGGTQAGLVSGAKIFGFTGKILGISVDEPDELLKTRVGDLATRTCLKMDRDISFDPQEILVNADYCSAGYGVLTDSEREAILLFARQEGLLLDPVYTGRAAAGMIDLARKNFFNRDETILFWHTGGQPALFAQSYQGQGGLLG